MTDEASFAAFVTGASRSLQRTAWLLTGDWASADDLTQTALLKTWTRWDRVQPESALAYTRRIMLTTFLSWRSRRWSGEVPMAALPEHGDVDGVDLDLRHTLLSALRALPRQQRAVIVLRYFDDLTEQAAARAMGCSVGTVKSHTSRALAALRTTPGLASLIDEGAVP